MEQEKPDNKKGPIVETKLAKSKNGRYVIHRTIITDIKPLKYYITMIERPITEQSGEVQEEPVV
jgi:hypothetical protein